MNKSYCSYKLKGFNINRTKSLLVIIKSGYKVWPQLEEETCGISKQALNKLQKNYFILS